MISDAYKLGDLQNCKSILTSLIDAGVLTVAEAIEAIDNNVADRLSVQFPAPADMQTATWQEQEQEIKPCPCGSGPMVGPYKIDGLRIIRCSRKCGHSEVVR